jgi:hypothetical protein
LKYCSVLELTTSVHIYTIAQGLTTYLPTSPHIPHMASAILFINQKGDEVMSRHYRTDISKTSIDNFKHKVGQHLL